MTAPAPVLEKMKFANDNGEAKIPMAHLKNGSKKTPAGLCVRLFYVTHSSDSRKLSAGTEQAALH